MIWRNHANLIIEHHKIRQAYRGSQSRNSIEVNYSDKENEEDDNNDDSNGGLESGDGTPRNNDVKMTPERQLRARAQIRYAEVGEDKDDKGDINGNEGLQKNTKKKTSQKNLHKTAQKQEEDDKEDDDEDNDKDNETTKGGSPEDDYRK